jgi:hypothetical protein
MILPGADMGRIARTALLAGLALGAALPASAQQAPRATAYSQVTAWPDWTGVWSPGVGAGSRTTATPPVLTAAGKAIKDAFDAGKAEGRNLQTAQASCIPNGMPGVMRTPYPFEFLYSPGRVTVLIETHSQIRRIYVDGRALPDDPDPAYEGHSVGHWEGDTLVVDTVGLSPAVMLIADTGLHATEGSRIHERFTRTGDRLVDEITVTDPTLLAEPYVMVQAYTYEPTWEMREYICQENNHDTVDAEGRPSMKLDDKDDPFGGLDD